MADPTTTAPAEREAVVPASLGVHDPVRADRPDGDRDLARPGRQVRPRQGRKPGPGHLSLGRLAPGPDPGRLAHRADQRSLRHRGRQGKHQLLQLGHAVRRDRRGPVHHRDRRVPRRHHADRRDPGRDRPPGGAPEGPGAMDDPDPDDGVRARRHDVRHGRGEPGVLLARHRGDDRRRVRRPHRRRGRPARLRHRHLRLDDQPVRHRHRLRVRRCLDQRRPGAAPDHADRRPRPRHLLRAPVRRPGQGRPVPLRGRQHARGERAALQRGRRRGRGRHDGAPAGDPGGVRRWPSS